MKMVDEGSGAESLRREYDHDELASFQSSIILESSGGVKGKDAKTMGEDLEGLVADRFLVQYSWLRRLSEVLGSLLSSSHFAYMSTTKSLRFPVSSSVDVFREQVERLERQRDEWNAHVDLVRSESYFVNYLDLKRCFEFVQCLQHQLSLDDFDRLCDLTKALVSCVNVDFSHVEGNTNNVAQSVLNSWNSWVGTGAEEMKSEIASEGVLKTLTHLAKSLDVACALIPRRTRTIELLDIASYLVREVANKGVFVAFGMSPVGESPRGQYDQLLSLSAQQGLLPEYESCLCCNSRMSFEHVSLLLLRWCRAAQFDRQDLVYYLVEADKLAYDVQHRVLELIRELNSAALPTVPLVVIAESDQCYLASHFQHNRLSGTSLPPHKLAEVCETLRSACHVSTFPGAGKTFNIRLSANGITRKASSGTSSTSKSEGQAKQPPPPPPRRLPTSESSSLDTTSLTKETDPISTVNNRISASTMSSGPRTAIYSHVPVNSPNTPTEVLISRLREAVTKRPNESLGHSDDTAPRHDRMIHLDISSTCGPSLVGAIFDLIVLGVISDVETTSIFSYDASNTSICVELASGSQYGAFSQCQAYGLFEHRASAEALCIDGDLLRKGMGDEDFFTSVSSDSANPQNAYNRLFYVLTVLDLLESRNGSFPALFDVERIVGLRSQERAHEVMVKYCSYEGGSPSFFQMWSFVNIVYSQLLELQDVESPIYLACLPDVSIQLMSVEFDTAMKERVKGEMFKFILSTARDFVNNQTIPRSFDPTRITAIHITGVSFIPESRGTSDYLTPLEQQERANFRRWAREHYDNDGRPVFKSCYIPRRQLHYYLYFRESENRWVIYESVSYTGPVYAYSQTADNDLENLKFMKVTNYTCRGKVKATLTSRGTSIEVTGFDTCTENALAAQNNGLYVLVDPLYDQDPVTGKYNLKATKHFYKDGPHARHLYYEENFGRTFFLRRCWVFSSTCNAKIAGGIAFSQSPSEFLRLDQESVWEYSQADLLEGELTIRCVRGGDKGVVDDAMRRTVARSTEPIDAITNTLDSSISSSLGMKNLVRWKDSNHESFLFNNKTGIVCFLSLNASLLKENMHPVLLQHLDTNHINIGEDLKVISDRHWAILSSLTGRPQTKQEAAVMMKEVFCLTGDSLLKILAIVHRAKCKIPVVLMGECGCGKTMLIKFLCAWMGVRLVSLDVHGGTTEQDIVSVFDRANMLMSQNTDDKEVYVFLDEVNTCDHMGIITEAICHRSVNGQPLHKGIQILAALNPYRLRPQRQEMGLALNIGTNPAEDIMSRLVYRVKPIPQTLKEFIFDFGSLEAETELLYITSMVRNDLKEEIGVGLNAQGFDDFGAIINAAQIFVRTVEGDPSVVSLRDVKRTIKLYEWFTHDLSDRNFIKYGSESILRAVVLSLAHVYYYRLSSTVDRDRFWTSIASICRRDCRSSTFFNISESTLQAIVLRAQTVFVQNLDVEDGISTNQALTENIFVAIVCILNKIPIFIVGKPGTSKTLAVQVIANNLQGQQSPKAYWRSFPSVHIFQYQCSPMSTTESIKYQFEAAKSFQEHSSGVLTVLLLDEVGLAENSPDMPLKVLHYMLVDPPIAIVGLSNWALDSSKMNRAILLQRPEPSAEDIVLTGQSIVAVSGAASPRSTIKLHTWLGPLSRVYLQIYRDQKSLIGIPRDFVGMRDYYSMAKFLREKIQTSQLSFEILTKAVARNFNGIPKEGLVRILKLFKEACFGNGELEDGGDGNSSASDAEVSAVPPALELIHDNLCSPSSRNLMVLSENDTILQLLFGSKIVDEAQATVLVGSRFKEDLEQIYLIQQINKVRLAMADGKTAILLNNDNIYESLYDVLNQRYVCQRDPETGHQKRLLRLAIGSRSQLCPVADGFKMIVIVKRTHAYENLDLPLLNRFEKQCLSPSDVLSPEVKSLCKQLMQWCERVKQESGAISMQKLFVGFYEGTVSSLLLRLTEFCSTKIAKEEILERAKGALLKMATPLALLYSKTLKSIVVGNRGTSASGDKDAMLSQYLKSRNDFVTVLNDELKSLASNGDGNGEEKSHLFMITTHSTADSVGLYLSNDRFAASSGDRRVQVTHLSHIESERSFVGAINQFYSKSAPDSANILVILCDPVYCDPASMSHAQYLMSQLYTKREASKLKETSILQTRHVVFVVNLPPGIANRQRQFSLDMYAPWNYSFVDELAGREDDGGLDILEMLSPIADLVESKRIDIQEFMVKNCQRAIVQCPAPQLVHGTEAIKKLNRILVVKELLGNHLFRVFVAESVVKCLKCLPSEANGMPLHVALSQENDMGSLSRSLTAAIDSVIVNAFAYVLRCLDENYNISLLFDKACTERVSSAIALWVELSNKLLNLDALTVGYSRVSLFLKQDQRSKQRSTDKSVSNTGVNGAFASRFPFSEKLIAFISDGAAVRNSIQSLSSDPVAMCQSLETLIRSTLHADLADQVYSTFLDSDPEAYLFDFIAARVHPMENLTFETQYNVIKAILKASHQMQSTHGPFPPAVVHVGYWVNESRIFRTLSACKLLVSATRTSSSSAPLSTDFAETLSSRLLKLQTSSTGLLELDTELCLFFLEYLESCLQKCRSSLSFSQNKEISKWIDLWTALQPDVDSLFSLVCDNLAKASDPTNNDVAVACVNKILSIKWRLKSWKVVLSECLNRYHAAEEPIAWESLLDAMTAVDPRSGESLASFIDVCNKIPSHRTSLVRCFVQKFVSSELEWIQSSHHQLLQLSPDLLVQVASLFVPRAEDVEYTSSDIRSLRARRETLSMQRAAIDLLYLATKSGYADDVDKLIRDFIANDNKAATELLLQLMIERIEDDEPLMASMANKLIIQSGSLGQSFSLISSFAEHTSLPEAQALVAREGMNLLTQIALAKRLGGEGAKVLANFLAATAEDEGIASFPRVLVLPSVDWHIYTLTMLIHTGGKACLLSYLRRDSLPIVPPQMKSIDRSVAVVKHLDPFAMISGMDVYAEACSALMQCRHGRGIEPLEKWSKASFNKGKDWTTVTNVLMSAMGTQITADKLRIDAQVVHSLTEWIKQGQGIESERLPMKIRVDFSRWLLTSPAQSKPLHLFLQVHLFFVASPSTAGWLHTLLLSPSRMTTCLIPSMADSELAQLLMAASTDADVGVYECPNGHMYTIGNCTRPWVTRICPVEGCGTLIGGVSHNSAAGNKSLGTARTLTGLSKQGYIISSTSCTAGYDLPRLGRLATVILRYWIHSLLIVSLSLPSAGGTTSVGELLFPDQTHRTMPSGSQIRATLDEILEQDWAELRSIVQMDQDEIVLAMHMLLRNFITDRIMLASPHPHNGTNANRVSFEQRLQRMAEDVFTAPKSLETIRRQKSEFEKTNINQQLEECLGTHFLHVLETCLPDDPARALRAQLWRYREPVTFDAFVSRFNLVKSNEQQFPITAAVLKHEAKLSLIKHAAHVLAWHAVLFKHLKSTGLTRDDARTTTNAEFIEKWVPEDQRAAAREVLDKFIVAFNAAIVLPGLLHECADNIFAYNGRVDLLCTQGAQPGVSMSRDTCLAFSLPNRAKKGNMEFIDPQCLCTGFILDTLQRAQDEVVLALMTHVAPVDPTGTNQGLDIGAGGGAVAMEVGLEAAAGPEVAPGPEVVGMDAPLFSYLTPHSLVARQLIDYDRQKHLMPVLLTHAIQNVEFGAGDLMGFDNHRIESDLRSLILPSAQPFAIAYSDFAFKGELQEKSVESTLLARLGQRIPQSPLPESTHDRIWLEIDTEPRRLLLTNQLDDCISFISATGGSGWKLDGEAKVSTFIIETMLVDEAVWASMECPTLTSSVCLKHLKSLQRGLRRRASFGTLFPDLDLSEYGEDISPTQATQLQTFARAVTNLSTVMEILEDFIWFKISQQSLKSFPGRDLSLMENIEYMTEANLPDDFYVYFPADLSVTQAHSTFSTLKKLI